jgi:tight adherence protein C
VVSPADWYPLLAAAGLCAAGVLLLAQSTRRRQRRLTERLTFVAPANRDADPAETVDPTVLYTREAGSRQPELAIVARFCRRFGVPLSKAPLVLTAARIGCALVLAGVVHFGLKAAHFAGGSVVLNLLSALCAGVLGWCVPAAALRRAAVARTRAVSQGLPDALELLVVCVEAGLALEDAIDRVTTELRASLPALAEELAMTSADLKVLPDRNQAFVKLAQRVNTPAIRSVVTTLSQTLRFGTPLASALRSAAAELRNDAIMTLEERAGSLPALMTVPLLVFILPTIFLIVGGPAILRLIDMLAGGG